MRKDFESNFVIGKVHIVTQYTLNSKGKIDFKEQAENLISKSSPQVEKTKKGGEKATWVFGDVGTMQIEGETILYGKLGKIKGDRIGTFYDLQNRIFKREHMTMPLTQSYSNFLIHPRTQTIIFEEKRPMLKIRKFIEMFEEIASVYFSQGQHAFLKIDLIKEEGKIFGLLKDKLIVNLGFSIRPSNPDDREIFKRLDEMLKKSGIEKGKMQFENKSDGLKLDEGGIAREAIALSDAGYGDYTAKVKDGEKTQTIRSKDNVVRETVPSGQNRENLVKTLFHRFKNYLKGSEKK